VATDIYSKQPDLTPSQMRTVAERRFDDAQALCATGENARANGAQYLCGIVIDILLKAQLVQRYPSVARKRPHEAMPTQDRELWSLIYRSHDLEEMLERLRDVSTAVAKRGERAGCPYLAWLKGICGTWTVFARYSTRSATVDEAKQMLERVRELKELLK